MLNNGISVLVVDDSVLVVNRIIQLLDELDCIQSVLPAYNYDDAIQLLHNNTVDIALLDINIPGRNGIELLTYIKGSFPQITSIMLTNQSDSYYRDLCGRIGADHFLDKTSEFENVPQIIRSLLKHY